MNYHMGSAKGSIQEEVSKCGIAVTASAGVALPLVEPL